jgi:hypothetical protein
VSFAADIEPLLSATCATNGCHDAGGGSGTPGGKPTGAGPGDVVSDLVLETGVSYAALVGQDAGCGGKDFVTPSDVSQSYLMNKLTGDGMCSGTQMPKGKAPFSQEQLDLIGTWICSGAPDN